MTASCGGAFPPNAIIVCRTRTRNHAEAFKPRSSKAHADAIRRHSTNTSAWYFQRGRHENSRPSDPPGAELLRRADDCLRYVDGVGRWLFGDGNTLGDVGGGVVESARREFAANLRRRREEIGLSQHDLAALAGLHRTEISLLERGLRSPLLETIVVLSSALELDSQGTLLEENDLAENRPIARTAGLWRL